MSEECQCPKCTNSTDLCMGCTKPCGLWITTDGDSMEIFDWENSKDCFNHLVNVWDGVPCTKPIKIKQGGQPV